MLTTFPLLRKRMGGTGRSVLLILFIQCALSSQAQMLKGTIPGGDKMRWGGIAYSRDFDFYAQEQIKPQYDAEGHFTWDTQLPGQFGIVDVSAEFVHVPVVVERGKTMTVTYTPASIQRKGYLEISGPNKSASEYLSLLEHRTGITAITGFGEPEKRVGKEEGLRILDETITDVSRQLSAIENPEAREFMRRYTEMLRLHYKLQILCEHQDTHVYARYGDERYRQTVAEINPNDPVNLMWQLPHRWVYDQIDPLLAHKDDLTDYALRYLEIMRPVITDPQVKHQLLDKLLDRMVSQGNPKDVDRFWNPIAEYAATDSVLLANYLPKIEALKSTRAGQIAPEQTFSDIHGQQHKLSDFHGKVLYIDVWATWCVPCKKEIPFFAQVADHFKDDPRIQLISISTDRERDHDKWRKMIADEKPAWPQFVMSDKEHEKLSADFNIQFIPRFIIINADGSIQNPDAPRPSQKDIISYLEKLLP